MKLLASLSSFMYEIMRRFSSQTHFAVAGMRPALLHASAMTRRLYATRCYGDSLHEWVEIDGTTATVGMTDFSRGFFMIDAVSLQVVVGEVVEANQRIGDMEGSKVMFDVLSPIAGTIMEVNEKLSAGLGSENEDDLWMMKLDAPNAPVEGLMTRAEFDVCVASVFVREQCSNFRRYSNSHEWVDLYQSAGASPMGMTFDGAMLTGAVRSVTLPQVGERIEAKQVIGKVEGSKSTKEIIAPISGRVVEVNANLEASPNLINESPEENGWLIKIDAPDASREGLDGHLWLLTNVDGTTKVQHKSKYHW